MNYYHEQRIRLKLSLAKMAKEAGLCVKTVFDIEHGKVIPSEVTERKLDEAIQRLKGV